MKNFNELTDEEKATLTNDQINDYIRYRMAESGTHAVENPGQCTIVKPKMRMQTWYKIRNTSILFKSMKAVEKFLELDPAKDVYDWDIGTELRYPSKIDHEIEMIELHDENELKERGQELIEYNKLYNEWYNKRRKYDDYLGIKNNATRNVWNAIHAAREKVAAINAIRNAYKEYVELADGNEEMALKFLYKTYNKETVNSALGIKEDDNDETTS